MLKLKVMISRQSKRVRPETKGTKGFAAFCSVLQRSQHRRSRQSLSYWRSKTLQPRPRLQWPPGQQNIDSTEDLRLAKCEMRNSTAGFTEKSGKLYNLSSNVSSLLKSSMWSLKITAAIFQNFPKATCIHLHPKWSKSSWKQLAPVLTTCFLHLLVWEATRGCILDEIDEIFLEIMGKHTQKNLGEMFISFSQTQWVTDG